MATGPIIIQGSELTDDDLRELDLADVDFGARELRRITDGVGGDQYLLYDEGRIIQVWNGIPYDTDISNFLDEYNPENPPMVPVTSISGHAARGTAPVGATVGVDSSNDVENPHEVDEEREKQFEEVERDRLRTDATSNSISDFAMSANNFSDSSPDKF